MTHTITALCTRQGDCVEVCPVDCIIPGPTDSPEWNDLFFIDPDTCIDCGACIPVCPPEAIFAEEDVPAEFEADTERNAKFFTDGPGYWDYDFEEERATFKGEASERDARVSGFE
jgi:ferredoxin--NADP+ reductase